MQSQPLSHCQQPSDMFWCPRWHCCWEGHGMLLVEVIAEHRRLLWGLICSPCSSSCGYGLPEPYMLCRVAVGATFSCGTLCLLLQP
jgi:hypothetical protein